ncbi:hypothetical protein GGF37_007168 [Kickxella alabastrina]|nr:hypothetical protein GGF37_007168 [Kickxella alabastrina]
MAGASKKTSKKSSTNGLAVIGGYKVLPVRFDDDSESATHYIYFKQHTTTKEDILLPSSRTLFLYNLPADTTERDIRRLFHGTARVARVLFHDVVGQDIVRQTAVRAQLMAELAKSMQEEEAKQNKASKQKGASEAADEGVKAVERPILQRSGGSAHVVLLEDAEMAAVLGMARGVRAWPQRDTTSPLEYRGLSRYLYEYRAERPPTELHQEDVDQYMAKFEAAQYERERMLEQQQNVPDADGFVTVVRRGRNTRNSDGQGAVTAATADEAREAGKKKKEVVFGNMYRFQVRERKKDQLDDLRKKFDEDKEKIARMRQTRQFRPY